MHREPAEGIGRAGRHVHNDQPAERIQQVVQLYFGATNFSALSAALSAGSSAGPAGKLPFCSRNAIASAACAGVSDPGLSAGIEMCVRSNRSLTVRSIQSMLKSLPASGG